MPDPAAPRRCPTHPDQPYDDCGRCEAKIARAEQAAEAGNGDGFAADRAADRYERWLNSLTP